MREILEQHAGEHNWYKIRRPEFETTDRLPFRVSPTPLRLSESEITTVKEIGTAVSSYVQAVDNLYRTDGQVRATLDTGKPEILLAEKDSNYLFLRPDLIITPNGFTMCEIETSPFGLALSQLLTKGYEEAGFETLVGSETLPAYVQEKTPSEGVLVYSQKTQSYGGQLSYLADNVFQRDWRAEMVNGQPDQTAYRGFYQSEYISDPLVKGFLDNSIAMDRLLLPSLTPHLEEKAVLAFLFDSRYQEGIRKQIGDSAFRTLEAVIPPTWIVGQEKYFAPGMPDGVSSAVDLAALSRAKRALVLKASGFSKDASWAEGVHFLGELSRDNATKVLQTATEDTEHLYVIQSFEKAVERPMEYEQNDTLVPMKARIRLTPYFSYSDGKLLAIKATGCENTDRLHASTTSINTAV